MNYLTLLVVFSNLIFCLIYYLRTRCELPLFVAFFNILVLYRNIALQEGWGSWVSFNYGIAFIFNNEMAEIVTNLMTMGSTVIIYSFIIFYSRPRKAFIADSNEMLKAFIEKNKKVIFGGLAFFSLIQLAIRGGNTGNYAFLIILGIVSFVLLFFIITTFSDKKKKNQRLLYFVIFAILAYLSYTPILRFKFLGWLIPVGYYLSRNLKPAAKLTYFSFGFIVVLVLFSIAGTLRFTGAAKIVYASNTELVDAAVDRLKAADDINFIDGFIMMYEVYPRYLDFTYGMQHLEIFLRPIPRTLWPDKPLAGWFQNYAAKYGTKQTTIGFSPTIYGVFYTEMGIYGLFVFGFFWGWLLSYFYRSFSGFTSNLSVLLIGILLAALIPILRSGDLPGDFAVVLMSYWPIIIFVQQYKKFVKQQLKLQNG